MGVGEWDVLFQMPVAASLTIVRPGRVHTAQGHTGEMTRQKGGTSKTLRLIAGDLTVSLVQPARLLSTSFSYRAAQVSCPPPPPPPLPPTPHSPRPPRLPGNVRQTASGILRTT